jgi:hypothetical protein
MFETIIAANPDACRTEAEIADESGNRVAIVYEDSNGWHTEVLDDRIEQASSSFNALIENAKEVLSHYVNRRGDHMPSELCNESRCFPPKVSDYFPADFSDSFWALPADGGD